MNEIGAVKCSVDNCSPSRDWHLPASVPAAGVRSSQQSYIALISMAILSSAEKRLVLADIYKILTCWLPERYNTATTAWRNSIRHNLSLNECFIKAGRAANGKGTIKPRSDRIRRRNVKQRQRDALRHALYCVS